ncbi:hypothetical protein HHK36_014386 [Tetracentron sinense]|uniref:DUF4220 domain-containing protein n=1 Tax=Tetracentron sinense TaxID=13715 RepID=A0A835DF52_TETSI|nr:hypothetical protein HHK36_014386 [Tetracentron sinense]
MEIFPERVQKLWNEWELRVMVLISLSLQIILIFLGKWRKYTAKNWIRIILWLAYLSADWVATVSLGLLANSQGDSSNNDSEGSLDSNKVLIACWAPFLLLHLGGPDTITAYSLEDNELWLRHLLGLIIQVGVAFYVFLRSWTGNRLSFLALPMFVPGLIKYGERTWVLRSASSDHLRVSMLTPPHPDPNHAGTETVIETFSRLHPHTDGNNDIIPDASILPVAYYYFQTFKRLFADLIINNNELKKSQRFFRENSWEEAFKVVEIELGFMYDVLYTKATIGYTTIDCVLRSISLSSTISLFVVFLVIEKHGYSDFDIIITYVLLVGAIILEIYAVIILLSSDWAILWLNKHKNSLFVNLIFRLISSFRLTSNKRWSNSMAQYNLLSFCLKDKPTTFHGIQKFYHINKKLENYRYTTLEEVSIDLKKEIFELLKMKSKSVTSLEDCKLFGGAVKYKYTLQHEFGHSIILWHITTDLFYNLAPDDIRTSPKCKMSKLVSDYMLYLLLMHPFMLPYGFMVPANFKSPKKVSLPNGVAQIIYQDTCVEAVQFFEKHKPISDKKEACKMLLDNTPPYKKGGTDNSVLFDCCRLAKDVEKEGLRKWEMISDVWVEMLIFAASKCRGNYHAQQLRQGGELLTHVWLLMAHHGITEQVQTDKREGMRERKKEEEDILLCIPSRSEEIEAPLKVSVEFVDVVAATITPVEALFTSTLNRQYANGTAVVNVMHDPGRPDNC